MALCHPFSWHCPYTALPMNPKVCVNLTNPENGVVDVKEEEHITIAVYTCNEGYVLNGTLEMKCNEGEWTETPPTCQRKLYF